MSAPTPAATLSQAVLSVVGRKYAAYSSTLDSDPHVSFSLRRQEMDFLSKPGLLFYASSATAQHAPR